MEIESRHPNFLWRRLPALQQQREYLRRKQAKAEEGKCKGLSPSVTVVWSPLQYVISTGEIFLDKSKQ
jgi:hypothetical protein